jgi:four helix bundle protein
MRRPFDINERSYEFSKAIVLFIKKAGNHKHFYPLFDQLLRSASSIGANVIEARSGNSRRNMISFYSIALRSANETKYWLRLIMDTSEIDKNEIEILIREGDELSRIPGRSPLTLKQNEITIKS